MTELKEAYTWLRNTPLPADSIPELWRWNLIILLHDIDKRITKLEKPAQALEDDGK